MNNNLRNKNIFNWHFKSSTSSTCHKRRTDHADCLAERGGCNFGNAIRIQAMSVR